MSEREKRTDYTNELNNDLLQMLGVDEPSENLTEREKFSGVEHLTPRRTQKPDEKSARRQKSISKKSDRDNQRTKHASPWKETAATRTTHPHKRDLHFLLLSLGIAAGVLVTAGGIVYISLLFLH